MDAHLSLRALATRFAAAAVLAMLLVIAPAIALAATPDTSEPTTTVKLVFIHHSTGEAWLQDGYGGLAASLDANKYFVSDTNYGWGPGTGSRYSWEPFIGSHTDIGDWWTWFRSTESSTYVSALYANTGINSGYDRSLSNPGGENTVIMFKSCYPNSDVGGSAGDAIPPIGSNPLAGNSANDLTVANAKGVYLDLLNYFGAHTDKLFVLVVSPPRKQSETDSAHAANARTLANWLVDPDDYLGGYTGNNVFVYDYYTVLTGGHHRIVDGYVEHSAGPQNYSAFPTDNSSHPSAAGDQIATAEFVPMLNAAYNSWRAGGSAALAPTLTRRSAYLSTPSAGKTSLSHKRSYTWRGNVSPTQIGSSSVRLQIRRYYGKKWHWYKEVSATLHDGAGHWALKLRVKKAGSYEIQVRHADGDHLSASSHYRKFKVR